MPDPSVSPSLVQIQEQAWQAQPNPPATSREAIGRLQATLSHCIAAFEEDHLVAAQTALEDVLLECLIAMRSLGLNPDLALQRTLARLQEAGARRAFHIFADRMEIRVNQEVRGGWPLMSQADYDSALSLARELDCDVIHEEASQLGLFRRNPDPPEPNGA